jgi:hypothetical protein
VSIVSIDYPDNLITLASPITWNQGDWVTLPYSGRDTDAGAYEYGGASPTPQCSDSIDNDNDGLTDYPSDPGCSSATDNDEYNPPPADTTPPTVSITSPANNQTVSGTITVTATASDDSGIAGVQFLLNGSNLNSEDVSPPYSTQLDTTTLTNGAHTLSAIARDSANNQTTSQAISINVSNAEPPSSPTNDNIALNSVSYYESTVHSAPYHASALYDNNIDTALIGNWICQDSLSMPQYASIKLDSIYTINTVEAVQFTSPSAAGRDAYLSKDFTIKASTDSTDGSKNNGTWTVLGAGTFRQQAGDTQTIATTPTPAQWIMIEVTSIYPGPYYTSCGIGELRVYGTKTQPPNTLPGDLNNDNIVNSLDWSLMNAAWFTSDPTADLNRDGQVNSVDFSVINDNWGRVGG